MGLRTGGGGGELGVLRIVVARGAAASGGGGGGEGEVAASCGVVFGVGVEGSTNGAGATNGAGITSGTALGAWLLAAGGGRDGSLGGSACFGGDGGWTWLGAEGG